MRSGRRALRIPRERTTTRTSRAGSPPQTRPRSLRPGGGRRGGNPPGEERDEEVERGRDPHRAREPDGRQQGEAPRNRSGHRAEGVHGIQAGQLLADHATTEMGDQHRQGGAHQRRGRQQHREEDREAHECEAGALGSQRPVERSHDRVETMKDRKRDEPQHAHAAFEPCVDARPVPAASERRPQEPGAQGEPPEKGRHDRRNCMQRVPEEIGELLRPHHFVEKTGRTGDEEAHCRPCRKRGDPGGAGLADGASRALGAAGRGHEMGDGIRRDSA